MSESYIYIKNAKIIENSLHGAGYGDILIKNGENGGKIVQMGKVVLPKGAKISVTDAKGAFACPGFVDLRTHLCAKGSRKNASAVNAAALAGGYSTLLLCPDTLPRLSDPMGEAELGKEIGVFKDTRVLLLADVDEIEKLAQPALESVVGFYDEGGTDTKVLRECMKLCAQKGRTLFVKCAEKSLWGGSMNEGERARQLGATQTPALCEELALVKYLMLAKDTGCRLHVHSVSTKGAVSMIKQAKADGISVTCDTCPQYFSLTEDQILFKGCAAKVDPPLRTIEDVMAVIEGLANGTVDAISTDHTPCDAILKRRPLKDAPFGMIMLETAFLIGITNLVEKGHLSIYRLIDAMCYAPLRILGKDTDKAEGINLFSLHDETYAARSMFMGGYTNSAFEGWHFSGKLIKYFPCEG